MSEGYWDYRDTDEWIQRMARRNLPPLIITAALTGGVQGKEVNPNHPETAQEQAEQAYECYELGASIIHVHARSLDNPTQATQDPAQYREINGLIRERCPDAIINNTTGGGGLKGSSMEERLRSIEANPEMASLSMGPMGGRIKLLARPPYRPEPVVIAAVVPNNYDNIEMFAQGMAERGVKPEMEVYNDGQLPVVRHIIRKGLVKPPYWVQLALGMATSAEPTPKNLIHMMELLPQDTMASVIAVGRFQTPLIAMAILLGLHVRTGMEDNTEYEPGVPCSGNAQLVERVVRISRELGRRIATPKEARQMLGLPEEARTW
ncbi:MAG: 3-keto-5-aminohexanoate cleavage protein [Chloroflexota bacterium]|nr:MAG: 3-keto-5-aminohexanoate cleavage protein [Chloroflexota bacterium]